MPQPSERPPISHRPAGNAIVSSLYAMAFIVGSTSLVAVLFQLSVAFSRKERVLPETIIFIVAGGVAGVAVALLMGAVGAIISYLQAQTQMMHRFARAQEDAAACLSRMSTSRETPSLPAPAVPVETPVVQQAPWPESQRMDQVLEILTELNENMLLTPEQRQGKRRQQMLDIEQNLSDTLGRLLTADQFVEAQAKLDQFARLFPEDCKHIEQFQGQIDQARAQVEQSEYEQAAAKVRDLMSTASWDRAEEIVQSLLKRHPKSQQVREMADAVRQEQTKFQQQHRQHLLSQIESLSSQREWREAYRLATELVSRFGDSPEGQIIKDKLGTLKENAQIEMRKQFEEQYKDLYRQHRYIEALALAQDVIAKYPSSPQAKALREQLPQLMNKAKLQMDQAGGGA